MIARAKRPPAAANPVAAVGPEYWYAACGTRSASAPGIAGPPRASIVRTSFASWAPSAGYQRPARCASLMRGTGPVVPLISPPPTPGGSCRLVPEREPESSDVGARKASDAAHDLDGLEQAAIRDRRLVVAATHGRFVRRSGVQQVEADGVPRARVERPPDGGATPAAAETAALGRARLLRHRATSTEKARDESTGTDPLPPVAQPVTWHLPRW